MSSNSIVSLMTLLDRWCDSRPSGPVVVDYDIYRSREVGKLVRRGALSAHELREQVLAMAVAFRRQGIAARDIVTVQLPNWHEFMVAHLALHAIGAVTSPLSPIYRKRDVARQLLLSSAATLIVPGVFGNFDHAAMGLELKAEIATLQRIVVVAPDAPQGALAWGDLLREGQAAEHAAERARIATGADCLGLNDMMLLNFSSGTTGQPKGVMHSTHSVMSCILPSSERLQLDGDDVIMVASTLGHGGGFLNGFYFPLHTGARVVYLDVWDAEYAIQIIEKERVTYGPVMPTYLFDLVGQPSLAKADLRSWVTGRVSGGAISRTLMAVLQETLPQLRLCPGWGMSETLISTCGSPDDPLDKRNRTEGSLVGDSRIEIRDARFEKQLPLGEVGEIVTLGASLLIGYFKQDELTRNSYTTDGWFKTGDLGRMDQDGYLTMVGRSKDLVIRGGENVPVVEVEQLLMEHPSMAGAAVIGIPDARLGEKVCAVVELKPGELPFTFDDMFTHLVGRGLTKQFIPQYLLVFDHLPRTPAGKIRKQDIRTEALTKLASAAGGSA